LSLQYAAFDLEIATEIPEGCDDWKALRPLGISCAAVYKVADTNGERYEFTRTWRPHVGDAGRYEPRMTPAQCREMAHRLMMLHGLGFTLVTFNGLGFDLDVLAEECDDAVTTRSLRALARGHVDVAFHFFAEKGFMCGLAAACAGMGLEGKTEGMSGALAPQMWQGSVDDQERVLEYVAQDARATGELYEAVLKKKSLSWITRRGSRATWIPDAWGRTPEGAPRMLTVAEAVQIPEPDVGWMDAPWPREKFTAWLED